MSPHPTLDAGVPPDTAAVAHAAFPRGHAHLGLRDALGPTYADARLADLSAREGQPAACPWRLARVAARAREGQPAFAADRRRRAGIEGTLSRGVRAMGLRRGRYLSLAKTHLQHRLTAAAINLGRLMAQPTGA